MHIDAQIERRGQFEYWLDVFRQRFHVLSTTQGHSYRIEVDGVSHKIDRDDGGIVHAPAPAVVISIAVKLGDQISAGDRLAVLEAMKMEMPVVAPFSGKVRQIMTIPNVQVAMGTPLLQVEPATEDDAAAAGQRVVFGESAPPSENSEPSHGDCSENLERLRQLMLGFDVDPKQMPHLLAEWSRGEEVPSVDEITRCEDQLLNIFVDICSLFQHEPSIGPELSSEEPSAEAYLFSYLRMLDTCGEGLPPTFVQALRRALSHYGVQTLDRSPRLEESLLWICKSHQRVEEQIAVVVRTLERRLRGAEAVDRPGDQSLRTLLDRMIAMTNGLFPTVGDLAREVRHRYFDQPLFEQARNKVYGQLEERLTYMAANPHAADRHESVRALVECPQPLVRLLSGRFTAADPGMRRLLLEAMTLRYYRIRTLENLRSLDVDGHCYVSAEYDYEGRRIQVFTAHTEYSRLSEAIQRMFPLVAGVPQGHDIVVDFYAWDPRQLDGPDATEREVSSVLNQAAFPRSIRRIVVEVAGPSRAQGAGGMQHFTYRPSANAYVEDTLYRGIHPMMAERLHLWRLNNFNIERLPSVEDVYLLHAVARNNPKDERLIACAEVRDVTPLRDETGRVMQLPHLSGC